MKSVVSSDSSVVKDVSKELKRYMRKEARENGFDTSVSGQTGSFSYSKGGSAHYQALLETCFRNYQSNPAMDKHMTESTLMLARGVASHREVPPRSLPRQSVKMTSSANEPMKLREKRMIATVSSLLSDCALQTGDPRSQSARTRKSPSSTPLWSPQSSHPSTPTLSPSPSSSHVSITGPSAMCESHHIHTNPGSREENHSPHNKESLLTFSSRSTITDSHSHMSSSEGALNSSIANADTLDVDSVVSQSGALSTTNARHLTYAQSTQTMDHKGIQVNFNERISQGVGATGVEDSSTQTAMHKGTQTDLSHLMNQFYLRYTEERVPLRAADQQHLCTAVENADLCTEVDLNSQVKDGGDCSSAEGEVDHQQEVHSGLETRSTGAEVLSLPLACPSDPCRDQSHNPVVCKALLEACRVGDVQCVEDTLSKHGMNGVCDECLEMTGLHCAASNGHLEVLQVFLKAGQNMNQTSATGKTALHYSAMNGHLECCRLLLEAGSDVHVCDSHEQTPLDLAKNLGHHNLTTTLEHTDDGEKLKPVVGARGDNQSTIDHSVSVASLSHDSSVTDALELPQTVCGQDLQDPSADEPNH